MPIIGIPPEAPGIPPIGIPDIGVACVVAEGVPVAVGGYALV
jgi:hypothetical protein